MITEKQSIRGTVSGKQTVSGKLVTSPSIDDTLTKEGCAAEAKATGDAIQKAKTEAVNDSKTHTNNHATDTNNPHAVTRSQIGAAPDGFGLGVGSYTNASTSYTTQEELDALVCNGFWAYRNQDVPLASADANTKYVKGITIAYSANHETQIGWCVYTGTCIVRERNGGVWQEWEFVSPIMQEGVEYRTTERWQSKVVYTKMLKFGSMPNATTASVTIPLQRTNDVRWSGVMKKSDGTGQGVAFPYNKGNTDFVDCCVTASSIYITAGANLSSWTGYITLYYTKD